jgi:hypothetical protein
MREALDLADLLIDGPFIAALAEGAGEWRGSRNQRLIPRAVRVIPPRPEPLAPIRRVGT